MAQFKGTVYLSTREFLLHRYDQEGVERALAELPPAMREALHDVTAVGWYDVAPVLELHRVMERLFEGAPGEVCYEAGKFSARWSMNSVLKVFVRFTSPHWLMDKATSVWGRYHDTGRWEFDPPEPKRLAGRLNDYAVQEPLFFHRLRGWVAGAIEMTGGANPRVQHVQRGEGHTFAGTWQ